MLHFGDISKINGFDVPITDVVVGGSPCQDLSVAGKRAGLDGERSGLFMEQLRIIKEMRENDRRNGRTDVDVRPRYMVWENVPGAFSSNKGEDFRIVLEETAKVADKDAYVPKADKWANAGCIMGDGWSIAWRVFDAQFWGVPQRRRRIALVADFGGQSAPEILFVRKSVSGDIEPSEPKGKETPCNASRGIGADDREGEGFDGYNGALTGQVSATLGVNCGLTTGRNGVIERETDAVSFNWQAAAGAGLCESEDIVQPLGCTRTTAVAYSIENHPADSRVNIDESGKVQTLTSRMGTGGGNVPMVMHESKVVALDRASYNQGKNAKFDIGIDEKGIAQSLVAKGPGAVCYHAFPEVNYSQFRESNTELATLKAKGGTCGDGSETLVVAVDARNGTESETNGALQSNSAHSLNGNNVVRVRYIVRRLTPMECERLQGYPDGWTDIGEYTDTNSKKRKSSDAARYKALGNSIAIPPWKWVMKRISACYERDATLASLFDGIGGFPYIWEQINGKGTCLWASEIEEFCIAVTKRRME